MTHAVYVALELLIGIDGNVLGKTVVIVHAVEHVVTAVFRFLTFENEVFQHGMLQFIRGCVMLYKFFLPG